MAASRITITLPADLVERIDQTSSNRSRFIAEAVERELHHRLREALRRSLDAPHKDGRKEDLRQSWWPCRVDAQVRAWVVGLVRVGGRPGRGRSSRPARPSW